MSRTLTNYSETVLFLAPILQHCDDKTSLTRLIADFDEESKAKLFKLIEEGVFPERKAKIILSCM